ncbi:protein NLRC3-like isoform X2 [Montipora capricornis]|uniref:protein NLRC3-like isoform X2 n=1 Tax=Montipora capricornis TaxID=246305 RepID=UPI0035F1BF85
MSKKSEQGWRPVGKVVKGIGLEILQGKKKEHQHSGAVDGKTKYTVLCCLLVRLGSKVLRHVFDRVIHPRDLWSTLKCERVHSELRSLRKEGILNPAQWIQLYPAKPSSVSSTGFDNSLLILLLRTICNHSPPATGWDVLPHSSDTSCESHIVRLKYCVNTVSAHAKEASVSDGEFCKYRNQIQKTLVGLGGAEYEDAIRKIEEDEMDPWDEDHFKELLKQWKDNDNRIKDKLNEWECIMKSSRGADPVQPEASFADVVSAAAGGSTHHEQDPVQTERSGADIASAAAETSTHSYDQQDPVQPEGNHAVAPSAAAGCSPWHSHHKEGPAQAEASFADVVSAAAGGSGTAHTHHEQDPVQTERSGADIASAAAGTSTHSYDQQDPVQPEGNHAVAPSAAAGCSPWHSHHKEDPAQAEASFADVVSAAAGGSAHTHHEQDPVQAEKSGADISSATAGTSTHSYDQQDPVQPEGNHAVAPSAAAGCSPWHSHHKEDPDQAEASDVSASASAGFRAHSHLKQDPVQAERSGADIASAAAGTSTHSRHKQDVPYSANNITERIRQLYSTRERSLLPVPWLDDFSFHLDDIFTKLKIVGKERTRGKLTDEITNMTAIFRGHKDCEKPRTVLIEGHPGMGKTTYCQKLAYDWAMKEEKWDKSFPEIDVLLLLRCRDIKTDIWEAIDDQILPDDVDKKVKEWFFEFIGENQSKVLLVLDGLDEVDSREVGMYINLLESKVLPYCHIVITSRHEAGKKVRRYCDTLWEIVGFTFEDAQIYILRYFKGMEHLAEGLLKQLLLHIGQARDLKGLTRNPLNTALLCILWEDFKGALPLERTQLYIEIVRCLLLRYEKRTGSSSGSDADLLEVYKDDLVQLGCMAFQCLRKRELYFDENEFKGSSSNLIKFGFLSIQTGGSKRKPSLRFAFLHKSFQELFAGFYLAYQILDRETDCKSVVNDERNRNEQKQVFLFMSGILSETSEEMTVSLVKSMAELASSPNKGMNKTEENILAFTFECILECKSHLQSKLLETLGQNFLVKRLSLISRWPLSNLFCEFLKVSTCLSNLYLGRKGIGSAGAESLSKVLKVNTCLTTLNLRENKIGVAGTKSLSEALKVNTCLTTLDLSRNGIGAAGAECLSKALKVNTGLTTLYLSGNEIGAAGTKSLSEALKVNTCLTTLDLSGNGIGETGAESLSEALKVNTCLTTLDLSRNGIGAAGAESLSEALEVNTCLTTLDLSGNGIGVAGAESLSEALKVNTCLTTLNCSENGIGSAGAESLSEALKVNRCLTTLDLNWNEIGAAGAESLSEALKVNTCLTTLDLSWNKIGAAGTKPLAEALKVNTCLISLSLKHNVIYAADAESLSEALKVNTCLTTLDLSWNRIGTAGTKSLAEALKVNTCLTTLVLYENEVGSAGTESLSEALKVNTCLTTLDLHDPFLKLVKSTRA